MRSAPFRASCGNFGIPMLFLCLRPGTLPASQARQMQQKLAVLERLPSKFSFVVPGDTRFDDDV